MSAGLSPHLPSDVTLFPPSCLSLEMLSLSYLGPCTFLELPPLHHYPRALTALAPKQLLPSLIYRTGPWQAQGASLSELISSLEFDFAIASQTVSHLHLPSETSLHPLTSTAVSRSGCMSFNVDVRERETRFEPRLVHTILCSLTPLKF